MFKRKKDDDTLQDEVKAAQAALSAINRRCGDLVPHIDTICKSLDGIAWCGYTSRHNAMVCGNAMVWVEDKKLRIKRA